MNEEFEQMYLKINGINGDLVTYDEIEKSFKLNVKEDTGGGKWVKCIYKDDKVNVLEFFIPKGERYSNVYHDFIEEHRVIIGELYETVLRGTYKSRQMFTAAKGVLHGFRAKKDTVAYSYCYNPKYK